MDTRIEVLAATLRLNTRLLANCLDGVDDALAGTRWCERTNHMAFLAAHLVGARAYLTGMLGGDGTDPFHDLLGAAKTIDEADGFPTVAEIMSAWSEVSARLLAALEAVDAETLAASPPFEFPIDDATVLGGVAFLVQHDSYHIGQLALLRKHWGLGAMSYD
jgi:hypothetical protein